MFLTPKFTIDRNVNSSMIGLSNEYNKFFVLEGDNIVGSDIPRHPKKILLTELGNGQALYLKDNGVIEQDFIQN